MNWRQFPLSHSQIRLYERRIRNITNNHQLKKTTCFIKFNTGDCRWMSIYWMNHSSCKCRIEVNMMIITRTCYDCTTWIISNASWIAGDFINDSYKITLYKRKKRIIPFHNSKYELSYHQSMKQDNVNQMTMQLY